jgi:CBS domain-containing protein
MPCWEAVRRDAGGTVSADSTLAQLTTAVPTGATVADVMVRHPKVLPPDASVDDVRALLAGDHVHMALLADDGVLRGTVVEGDVPPTVAGDEPAAGWSQLLGRTVAPDEDAELLRQELVVSGRRRLAVVDDEGRLLGLLCLKRRRTGFCSDADAVAAGG